MMWLQSSQHHVITCSQCRFIRKNIYSSAATTGPQLSCTVIAPTFRANRAAKELESRPSSPDPSSTCVCEKTYLGAISEIECNDVTLMLQADRTSRNPSSILNSIPLTSTSGDGIGSDLGHYCAEIVTLGLRAVSVSGRLPGRVPAIRREGFQTKRFGL